MLPIKNNHIKDFEIYLRLARQARHKPERDYYVTCARLVLRKAGWDVQSIPEDPNLALNILSKIDPRHPESPEPVKPVICPTQSCSLK